MRRPARPIRFYGTGLFPLPGRQNRLDPFQRPVDVLLGDDQRRGEADDVVVGLLAQEPFFHEPLAEAAGPARLRVKLHADKQALAPYLLNGRGT